MTTKIKSTKKTQKRFDFSDSVKQVKNTAKDMNDFVLETSEEMVEGTITRVGQWQEVGEKAVKGGLKLVENQQDLMFTVLETLKSQFVGGRKRFRGIFN